MPMEHFVAWEIQISKFYIDLCITYIYKPLDILNFKQQIEQ